MRALQLFIARLQLGPRYLLGLDKLLHPRLQEHAPAALAPNLVFGLGRFPLETCTRHLELCRQSFLALTLGLQLPIAPLDLSARRLLGLLKLVDARFQGPVALTLALQLPITRQQRLLELQHARVEHPLALTLAFELVGQVVSLAARLVEKLRRAEGLLPCGRLRLPGLGNDVLQQADALLLTFGTSLHLGHFVSQLAHRGGQVAFGVSPDPWPGLAHRRARQFTGRVLVDRDGELRLRVSDQLHRYGEPGLQGAIHLARRDALSVSARKRRQVNAALPDRDREAERGRLVIDPRSRQGEPEQRHVSTDLEILEAIKTRWTQVNGGDRARQRYWG